MANQVTFNTDDAVIQRSDNSDQLVITGDPTLYFEIEQCTQFVKDNEYSRVAIQFPDTLMSYAQFVVHELEKRLIQKVFLLADTTYGYCCVDEVAAAHIQADAIIHFGHTCLSSTEILPVLYVFGREHVAEINLISKLKEFFPDHLEKILLFYDVPYHRCMDDMQHSLQDIYPNMCFPYIEKNSLAVANNQDHKNIFGRLFKLTSEIIAHKVLFIGEECLTLRNLVLTLNKNQVYSYNPKTMVMRKEGLNVNKSLMRRFYLIEKAKDAQIVGIVMGTLAVKRYKEMVERTKKVLRMAGKKFYTFIVGKINVAKLANFMEIDIFVLIACPENTLIDSKEFYKPIVTPFEMEIACLQNREWTGDYIVDFKNLLSDGENYVNIDDENAGVNNEPEISLITGKLRSSLRSFEDSNSVAVDGLVLRDNNLQLTTQQPSSAIEYLATRTWQGLQIDASNCEIKKAHDGRSGIAMNYANEPNS